MSLQVGARTIATVDVGDQMVDSAWNMLRVLVGHGRARVWLNPNFADITGASGPPKDELRVPSAPPPLIDAQLDIDNIFGEPGGGHGGLSARASTGQWRIDYASVLPQPASFA